MSKLHFTDNTVLVNFCLVGELELLEKLLGNNGAWSATVEIECSESAKVTGLEDLVRASSFLGIAYAPESAAEIQAVAAVRETLRAPGDGPEKHLGEAETLALIEMRSLDAVIVTDDTGAIRAARKIGVGVVTTASLLVLATRVKWISAQRSWDLISELSGTHQRFLPGTVGTFADHCVRCGVL